MAVISRVATVCLMILGNALLHTHDAGGVHKFRPRTFPVSPDSGNGGGVFSAFTRWDSAWFLSIADSDYPQSSAPSTGSRPSGDGIDCRGTARAWGGEKYEHDGWVHTRREEAAAEKEGGDKYGDGDGGRLPKGDPQARCRPDVPLEEQAHAFFPLYPWLVRWAAAALRAVLLPVGFVMGRANSLILAAVFISNSCFVAAAVLLYRLGAVVTGDSLLAHRGALAFCVTPASVFFSTAYTESLYAALSFAGLLALFSEGRRRSRAARPPLASGTGGFTGVSGGGVVSWGGAANAWVAAALLSLATLARSNGIAGAGVLVLEKLRWIASDAGLFNQNAHGNNSVAVKGSRQALPSAGAAQSSPDTRGKGTGAADEPRGTGGGNCGTAVSATAAADCERNICRGRSAVPWLSLAASLVATALQALLILAPYVLVQAYAYRKFCLAGTETADGLFSEREGEENGGGGSTTQEELARLVIERLHPWCTWKVPSLYAHVQSAYWGVGALRYYKWKQIPNFLLAAPALVLTACGTARFFSAQLRIVATPGSRKTGGSDKDEGTIASVSSSSPERGTGGGGDAAGWNCDGTMRLCPAWLSRLAAVFFGAPELPHPGSSPLERTGAAALVAQWAFLAFFAAICMNVQVATRFLAAACPPLHWWTASLLVRTRGGGGGASGGDWNGEEGSGSGAAIGMAAGDAAVAGGSGGRATTARTALRWYLGLYFVVGAVLHANFLPWT